MIGLTVKYKKTIMLLCKMAIVFSALALYMFTLFQWYETAALFYRGNYVIGMLYGFLLIAFCSSYGCFRIGVLRLQELVYSFMLSITLTNFAAYFQLALTAQHLLNPLYMAGLTVVQIAAAVILYFFSNRIYFILYPARDVVAIHSGSVSDHAIINRFEQIYDRYKMCNMCLESEGYAALCAAIDKQSSVLLCDIERNLRYDLISYCYENNKRLYIVPSLQDIMINNAHETQISDSLVYLCKNRGMTTEQEILKRGMDIVLSALGVILTGPIMLITALCIKLSDGGPVFFRQCRLTRNGKGFMLTKFRSMVIDAEPDGEARLATKNDQRITPVGRCIRRLRIDELPQLFNILSGSMSIVGPRPERPEIMDQYADVFPEFQYRLKVKAGLTGYAQVFGKYNTTFEDKVKMDLLYIERYSLILDLKLMLATIKTIFVPESTEGLDEGEALPAYKEEDLHL
ncbi:MAG: sugar transferase [Eubacteriales bacterium]|nr:sugar transferase [Eubacteriales bacterium]